MIIQKHYHIDNDLQRSVCVESGRIVRRIARFVNPEGDVTSFLPDKAVWQERQDDCTFRNVSGPISCMLEKSFVEALIEANRPT